MTVKLTVCTSISSKWVEDEVVVYDRDRARVHTFNRTGGLIWREIERGTDSTQIPRRITAVFDVDMETAQNDCARFIDSLLTEKIVTPSL